MKILDYFINYTGLGEYSMNTAAYKHYSLHTIEELADGINVMIIMVKLRHEQRGYQEGELP